MRYLICIATALSLQAVLVTFTIAETECGWILMVPPRGVPANQNVPLKQMIQESAYDSAQACESAKNQWIEEGMKMAENPKLEKDARGMIAVYLGSLCVPASSVYPPRR